MFKKTLIAATLAALSTNAMAVDVATSTAITYGNEGLASGLVANDASVLTLGATQLALGAEYSVGDTISITIAGGTFDPTDAFLLTDNNTNVGSAGITAGLLSATANSLLFRVTAIDTTNGVTTIGELMDLELAAAAPVPVILGSTAVGAKLTVSANAATSTGLAIDVTGATDSKAVGSVITQHDFEVTTSMAAQIDVSKGRLEFVAAGGNVTNPTFSVTYTQVAPTQAAMAITDTTYTINGSMTGYENTVAATDNDGTIVGDNVLALTVAADLQSASDTTGGVPSAVEVFTFAPGTVAERLVLNIDDYSVDVKIEEVGGKSVSVSGLAAGSMGLNGSSAQYAYAPVNYDGAVTTNFEISNSGAVDGEITITAFDTAGNDYSAILDFKAEAGKVTRVSDADISAAFALTAGTKLNLTFTVNAPSDDVTYGAYSNRGTTGRMAINKL